MLNPITQPKKRGKYLYRNVEYDSKEEIYFRWYLDELFEGGYISGYTYQPNPFKLFDAVKVKWLKELKTKMKLMESTLLQPHEYTPDFSINWENRAWGLFIPMAGNQKKHRFHITDNRTSYIEIKPGFDKNNMTRQFHLNQKWIYQRYRIYIQKIVPQKLFKSTFTPIRYLYTDKSRKPRKIDYRAISLKDFCGSEGKK